MGARGFIFSLDAFVAFMLLAVVISLLIFATGVPRAYYPELEQAHLLAHDTLYALANSPDPDADGIPYLDEISGLQHADPKIGDIMRKIAGGDPNYKGIIPKGYGYRLESYNYTGTWATIYDSATDDLGPSDRYGKLYTKLQASATIMSSVYPNMPVPGESPYCYKSCRGYSGLDKNGDPSYANPCNTTPCDAPGDLLSPGDYSIRLYRLIVYT